MLDCSVQWPLVYYAARTLGRFFFISSFLSPWFYVQSSFIPWWNSVQCFQHCITMLLILMLGACLLLMYFSPRLWPCIWPFTLTGWVFYHLCTFRSIATEWCQAKCCDSLSLRKKYHRSKHTKAITKRAVLSRYSVLSIIYASLLPLKGQPLLDQSREHWRHSDNGYCAQKEWGKGFFVSWAGGCVHLICSMGVLKSMAFC